MTWEEVFATGNWEMGCLLAWHLNGKTKPTSSTLWVRYVGPYTLNLPDVEPGSRLYEMWYRR